MTAPKTLHVGLHLTTRRGLKARVLYHLKTANPHRFVVVVTDEEGTESAETYCEEGRYDDHFAKSSWDLVLLESCD